MAEKKNNKDLRIKELEEQLLDYQKQLLEALAENNQLRENIELLKSQLSIYETLKLEEPKKKSNAGRKKADPKWAASYGAFCDCYKSQKSITETMRECGISKATYYRYKKIYDDMN